MTYHHGLAVDVMPTSRGTTVFAEVFPAGPLVCWAGFGRRRGWRACWPVCSGRGWQILTRWWFEVHEVGTSPEGESGVHWHHHDGGGVTLRGALFASAGAVEAVLESIRRETTATSGSPPPG